MALSIAQISGVVGQLSVKSYGAVGDGVTDDTTAVNAAYTAAPAGSVVLWPRGTYKITGQISIRKNSITTQFGGGGEDGGVNLSATTATGCAILHVPTAAGTLFDIASATPASLQLNNPGFVGNVLVYSTDTTYSKTAFKFSNVSRPYFSGRIHIAGATGQGSYYRGSSGGDGGSVGIYVLGREQYNFDNVLSYAQVPLRFGKNPDASGYDMDHVYFSNAILAADVTNAPSTLIHSDILIDNDVRISVATFDGHIALVGGKHKLYWKPTSNSTASGRLTLRNVLTEQETDATAYAIHIEIPDASAEDLESLTLENCILGNDQYGIYTKNVSHIWINGLNAAHTTGQKLLKCEGASAKGTLSVGWDNLCLQATAPSSLIELPTDLILSFASQVHFGSSRAIPSCARYTKNDTDLGSRRAHMRTGDMGVYSYYATLAPAAQYKIPANSDQRGVALGWIDVAACSNTATNTVLIGGRVVIAATDGGTRGLKIAFQDAGALLEVGAATSGKLSVTCGLRIAADLVITNNHASETLKVLVQAHYYSTTWA